MELEPSIFDRQRAQSENAVIRCALISSHWLKLSSFNLFHPELCSCRMSFPINITSSPPDLFKRCVQGDDPTSSMQTPLDVSWIPWRPDRHYLPLTLVPLVLKETTSIPLWDIRRTIGSATLLGIVSHEIGGSSAASIFHTGRCS